MQDHLCPTKNNAKIREVTFIAVKLALLWRKYLSISQKKKSPLKIKRQRCSDSSENYLKKTDVRGWRKTGRETPGYYSEGSRGTCTDSTAYGGRSRSIKSSALLLSVRRSLVQTVRWLPWQISSPQSLQQQCQNNMWKLTRISFFQHLFVKII